MFGDLIDRLILKVRDFIFQDVDKQVMDTEFLEREIEHWKGSPQRIAQIKGFLYYEGKHDVLKRKRTMIGEDGKLQVVENLPNNRIVDNQYAKMVNQKTNYLFGQPFVSETQDKRYEELLKSVFNKRFMRTLKNSAKAAYNGGIAWLHPYYTDTGELAFRVFPAYEILPFWEDSEHTMLSAAVRLYPTISYNGGIYREVEHVEVYEKNGIRRYILDSGKLKNEELLPYVITGTGQELNWTKIPLIPLKANEQEQPLLRKVKSLQDGINIMLSDFVNGMQEDTRNTILVLKNYDGTDLGEFRRNLATFGAIKIRYDDTAKGGVETLNITVNADNYKAIIEIFKKALIENAMGYDAKDDRLSGNPNQMNIQSMYSDVDLDANDMETEYQAAFEEILWFVNMHLVNTGQGDYTGEDVNIIFNRDILINESEAIDNCQKSLGILSEETIIGQHPWIDEPQQELERLKKQREEEQMRYNPFEGGEVVDEE